MGEGIHKIKGRENPRRDIDKGLNKREKYTLSRLEGSIRDLPKEKAYFVDNDGNVMAESYTNARSFAKFRDQDYRKAMNRDAIMTHNHPVDFSGIAGRIGNPFSSNDILAAAQLNLKEIRAATPTYTYSLRRPKGGWPSVGELKRTLKQYNRQWKSEARRYMERHRGDLSYDERVGRANVGMQNSGMRMLEKMYGWEFTRKKVK